MTAVVILLFYGVIGGLLFEWLHLPGGPMTGAIIAVILYKTVMTPPNIELPRVLQLSVYIFLGVIVGNMYKPGMLLAVKDTWPVLLISTGLILVSGLAIAVFVFKFGKLDAASAYLATSPGGLNAIMGLAADMGPNAPIILAYQMVRLYTIILTVPYASKLLYRMLQ